MAEQDLLAPVPEALLASGDWAGVFDLLKLREAGWGKDQDQTGREKNLRTKGVPFGSPVFVCYYRADLLEKIGRRPPQNWTEYFELAKALVASKPSAEAAWCGAMEPLAPGWAGLAFLARAASYAKHRDNYSTLFNIDTMEPLLTTPAFTAALEDMAAAAKFGPADPFSVDPSAARRAVWKGQCGLAITWPTAAGDAESAASAETKEAPAKDAATDAKPEVRVGVVELPGAKRVYNRTNQAWDMRADDEDTRVTLLTVSGRMGMVNKQSPAIDAAFSLLSWLSDGERCRQVSAASPDTTLFARSQTASAPDWVEKSMGASTAGQYAVTVETALCREQCLAALPLPGRAEYLAALDAAVAAAVRGEKSPADALKQANAEWQKITERLGVDRQKAAYRHSLGW